MALHFILDGYNIVKQTPVFVECAIDIGRERLIRAIEMHQPQGSMRNLVTVVFDGRPGMVSPRVSSTVQVIFSYDESADDRIKAIVEQAGNKKEIVVVTNDREIQRYVKALGATVWPVKIFVDRLGSVREEKESPVSGRGSKPSRIISKTAEHAINSELEKIWLKNPKSK